MMIKGILLGLIQFYSLAIIVSVLMSWIPDSGEGVVHDLRMVLSRITEPYLSIFRRFIPTIGGMIDISPIFAILFLEFLSYLVRVYL